MVAQVISLIESQLVDLDHPSINPQAPSTNPVVARSHCPQATVTMDPCLISVGNETILVGPLGDSQPILLGTPKEDKTTMNVASGCTRAAVDANMIHNAAMALVTGVCTPKPSTSVKLDTPENIKTSEMNTSGLGLLANAATGVLAMNRKAKQQHFTYRTLITAKLKTRFPDISQGDALFCVNAVCDTPSNDPGAAALEGELKKRTFQKRFKALMNGVRWFTPDEAEYNKCWERAVQEHVPNERETLVRMAELAAEQAAFWTGKTAVHVPGVKLQAPKICAPKPEKDVATPMKKEHLDDGKCTKMLTSPAAHPTTPCNIPKPTGAPNTAIAPSVSKLDKIESSICMVKNLPKAPLVKAVSSDFSVLNDKTCNKPIELFLTGDRWGYSTKLLAKNTMGPKDLDMKVPGLVQDPESASFNNHLVAFSPLEAPPAQKAISVQASQRGPPMRKTLKALQYTIKSDESTEKPLFDDKLVKSDGKKEIKVAMKPIVKLQKTAKPVIKKSAVGTKNRVPSVEFEFKPTVAKENAVINTKLASAGAGAGVGEENKQPLASLQPAKRKLFIDGAFGSPIVNGEEAITEKKVPPLKKRKCGDSDKVRLQDLLDEQCQVNADEAKLLRAQQVVKAHLARVQAAKDANAINRKRLREEFEEGVMKSCKALKRWKGIKKAIDVPLGASMEQVKWAMRMKFKAMKRIKKEVSKNQKYEECLNKLMKVK